MKKRLGGFLLSLLSRKFLLAVVAAFVAFGNSYFDWGLSTEQVWGVVVPLLAFIGIEGAGDMIERSKQ